MSRRRAPLWVLLTSALLAGCSRQDSAESPAELAPGRVSVNFGGGTYGQYFRPEKAGDDGYITADAQGLRIVVPQGATGAPVGLAFRGSLRGDFGVVVSYELLKAETPKDWGSGLQVLLKLETPGQDTVFVARQARGAGQSFVFQHMTTGPDGRRVSKQSKVVQVDPTKPGGTIGLARLGSSLAATYTLGTEPAQTLGRFEVGNDPVELFRVAANPERGKNAVDVRLIDVDVRAEQMSVETTPARPRRPLTAMMTVVTLIVVVGVVAWLIRRRTARPAIAQANPGETQ